MWKEEQKLFNFSSTHPSSVDLLLQQNGIEVNQARMSDEVTPLYIACSREHSPIVDLLLQQNGIDVNIQNIFGIVPNKIKRILIQNKFYFDDHNDS